MIQKIIDQVLQIPNKSCRACISRSMVSEQDNRYHRGTTGSLHAVACGREHNGYFLIFNTDIVLTNCECNFYDYFLLDEKNIKNIHCPTLDIYTE